MDPLDPSKLSDRQLLLMTYESVNGLTKRMDRHSERISNLESWRTFLVGAGTVVGAAVAAGFQLVIAKVEGWHK